MRNGMYRIAATGAGSLLALGLLAGPSAADGSENQSKADSKVQQSNKVTCFQPEGKTQGRSLSDPDDMENGGADKSDPDCNGCGNDDDREDDNNGNCEGDGAQGPGDAADQPGDDRDDTDTTVNADEVAGDVEVQAAGSESDAGVPAAESTSTDPATVSAADATTPAAATTAPETQVLGETLTAPDTLPRTGAAVGGLALLGGLLVGGGRLTVLARKLLRIG
jgi:hypothetical protein